MNIAVLFDGAGLARLGLEQAGHTCTGFELDPWKHYLSKFVGSGNCHLADVRDVDLSGFDAIWASPPCQLHSSARTQGAPTSEFAIDLREWSLRLGDQYPLHKALWVENVTSQSPKKNAWGTVWNAAQFLAEPIQNRNRIVGGAYRRPVTFHPYKKAFPGICPCITASEYKGCKSDARRASRFYGRRITIEEAAYRQGFNIPGEWYAKPAEFPGTQSKWTQNLYEAIGNGVPVYMARAFGEAYEPAVRAVVEPSERPLFVRLRRWFERKAA